MVGFIYLGIGCILALAWFYYLMRDNFKDGLSVDDFPFLLLIGALIGCFIIPLWLPLFIMWFAGNIPHCIKYCVDKLYYLCKYHFCESDSPKDE